MTLYYDLFSALNHTELYQFACLAGHAVAPSLDREALLRIIVYEDEARGDASPLDAWRTAIMQFVLAHRKQLETQLTCPAKTFDPRACFGCLDTQVVSCLVNNQANLPRIAAYRRLPVLPKGPGPCLPSR